jgi:glucose/mannose-6-phosphate isomerase
MGVDSHLLDHKEKLAEIDASDMLGVLARFPGQLREAEEISAAVEGLPSGDGVSSVSVLGMGGSGISGDVVGALVSGSLPVPFATHKGYDLPAYVGAGSLVFAVSYSGNTEETLTATEDALAREARVIAVTSGGKLEELAKGNGLPVFKIPGGQQPRASLGYLAVPILCALEKMGLVTGFLSLLEPAAKMLDERAVEYSVDNSVDDNPTKRLARDTVGYLPVIYGSEGFIAVAAKRWKAQFNENAKVPAFDNQFPELNHNETVGWQHLEDICSMCHLIMLRDDSQSSRIARRIELTSELIHDDVGHITSVWARGDNPLERLFDLIYFGDCVSVYAALAIGQDPTPVTRIEDFKKRLAAGGS